MTSIIFKNKSCKVLITYAVVLYLYHKKIGKKFKVLLQLKYKRYMTIFTFKIFLTSQFNFVKKNQTHFFTSILLICLICAFPSFGHISLQNHFFKKLTRDSFITSKIGLFILYKLSTPLFLGKKPVFLEHVSSWVNPYLYLYS